MAQSLVYLCISRIYQSLNRLVLQAPGAYRRIGFVLARLYSFGAGAANFSCTQLA